MSDLFAGLESLGFNNLDDVDVYEKEKREEETKAAQKTQNIEKKKEKFEEETLYDKEYECPCCGKVFHSKAARLGKVKLKKTDLDLRPVYEQMDLLKYDAVVCTRCGYAALTRFFKNITFSQVQRVKEQISKQYTSQVEEGPIYTYTDAIRRHKMVLLNAIVKGASASEKAYICLKTGWILRGRNEALNEQAEGYKEQYDAGRKEEQEFLKNALEGFLQARKSESFPMCGMDEPTIDYLIAALATECGEYDTALHMISSLLSMRGISSRMKEHTRDLRDIIAAKKKDSK